MGLVGVILSIAMIVSLLTFQLFQCPYGIGWPEPWVELFDHCQNSTDRENPNPFSEAKPKSLFLIISHF